MMTVRARWCASSLSLLLFLARAGFPADPPAKFLAAKAPEIFGRCLSQRCGQAGPFPTVERLCNALKQRVATADVSHSNVQCHLSREPRTRYTCDGDDKCRFSQPDAWYKPSGNAAGLQEAVLFLVSSDATNTTAPVLAVRMADGWHSMTELGSASGGGAGGVFDADIRYLDYRFAQLTPEPGEELLLTYRMEGHDIDQGINRVFEYSTTGLLLCGARDGKPYCTRRIPKQSLRTYRLLFPEEEEAVRKNAGPQQTGTTYRHAYQLETRFDPVAGTITFSFANGSPLKGTPLSTIQPLLGTHQITSLQ